MAPATGDIKRPTPSDASSSEAHEFHQDLRDYLEVLIADRLEQRIMDRENKRFRMLYIVFAVVTAIGLGVFLNQISISADAAVEKRLGETLTETEDFKDFTKLLFLGTQLDVKDRFSETQRDEATSLAILLYDKPEIASDKSYISIVEQIVDALAATDNNGNILQICRNTKTLCTDNHGIAFTVMEVFGKKSLAAASSNSIAKEEHDLFTNALSGLRDSQTWEGDTIAYSVLSDFHEGLSENKIRERLRVVRESNQNVRERFILQIATLSDRNRMSTDPTPEIIAVESLTKRFMDKFKSDFPSTNN